MKNNDKDTPIIIEKGFNFVKSKINKHILKEDSQIPPNVLFQQLDDEFVRVEKKYKEKDDRVNFLHVKHNYLWSKSFQYLHKDPTVSLKLIIFAISALVERNSIRAYHNSTFIKMLRAYEVALIKISEKLDSFKISNLNINTTKRLRDYVDVIDHIPSKRSRLPSLFYGVLYKMRKRQLHFLVKFM
ncbi:unnamed protein product, partial [marine sediment metagenome]